LGFASTFSAILCSAAQRDVTILAVAGLLAIVFCLNAIRVDAAHEEEVGFGFVFMTAK
jgi:hypothetical protein